MQAIAVAARCFLCVAGAGSVRCGAAAGGQGCWRRCGPRGVRSGACRGSGRGRCRCDRGGGVAGRVPANASLSGSVLILSTSVNGGSSSAEAQQATALGLTVTVATPTTWDAMTQANFATYNGDHHRRPVDVALLDVGAVGCAVDGGDVGSGGDRERGGAGHGAGAGQRRATLISDAIAYAASGGSGRGLYVSLNCEYSSASAGTAVPLLAERGGRRVHRDGPGLGLPGQRRHGEYLAGAGAAGVQRAERRRIWGRGPRRPARCRRPSVPGRLGWAGLGTWRGASRRRCSPPRTGRPGQAYILAGAPVSAGDRGAGAVDRRRGAGRRRLRAGRTRPRRACPGDRRATRWTPRTATSPSPTPTSRFRRSGRRWISPGRMTRWRAQGADPVGTPGPLGYGWTDNWASSLTSAATRCRGISTRWTGWPRPGSGGRRRRCRWTCPRPRCTTAGTSTSPIPTGNRIEEVPGSSGTQWGISMTAGDVYTIAGSPSGNFGTSPDGTPASQSLLNAPGRDRG